MPRRVSLALAVVCLCLLSADATVQAEDRSAPRDMVARLLSTPLPGRDPLDLAVRLRGLSPTTPLTVAPAGAAPLASGREDSCWVLDQRTRKLFQARATLRLLT